MDFKNWLLIEEIFPNNTATVYHRTGKQTENPQQALEGIFSSGYQIGRGMAYGPGLYTTLTLEDQFASGMIGYGKYIVALKVENMKNYLIFLPTIAKHIYNDNTITLAKQIKELGINISATEQQIKDYDDQIGFTPGKPTKRVVGDIVDSFVRDFNLSASSTTNCKGIVYNDGHGYVLLVYPPLTGITPIKWVQHGIERVDPSTLQWNNMRNLAAINFPEKEMGVKNRKVKYQAPQSAKPQKGGKAMDRKSFVAFVNDVKTGKKLATFSYAEYDELEKALQFLNKNNLSINSLILKIPDESIKSFGIDSFITILINKSNPNSNNNASILKVLNIINKRNASYLSQIYACADKLTSNYDEIRNHIVKDFETLPSLENISDDLDQNYYNEKQKLQILEDYIKKIAAVGKQINLSSLASINPRLYIRIALENGTLQSDVLEYAIARMPIYNIKEAEEVVEFFQSLNNPKIFTDFGVYKLLLPKFFERFKSADILKLVPQNDIISYLNDPQKLSAEHYISTSSRENVVLLLKYKDKVSDSSITNIIQNLPNLGTTESESIVEAIIDYRKRNGENLKFDEIKSIIKQCQSLSDQTTLRMIDFIPDEQYSDYDDDQVKQLLNLTHSFEIEKALANKISKSNNKISDSTKTYLDALSNSTIGNSPFLMPTEKDFERVVGSKITKYDGYSNITNLLSTLKTNTFKDKNKEQKDIDQITRSFENWLLKFMDTVNYTNSVHNLFMNYINRSIDAGYLLENLPENTLEFIFKNLEAFNYFKTIVDGKKSKLSEDQMNQIIIQIVKKVSQNPKLKNMAKVIPRMFGKKAMYYT